MITEQFIISSIKSKDKYFILYDKSIVFVKQIKKHSGGEVMLEVRSYVNLIDFFKCQIIF